MSVCNGLCGTKKLKATKSVARLYIYHLKHLQLLVMLIFPACDSCRVFIPSLMGSWATRCTMWSKMPSSA